MRETQVNLSAIFKRKRCKSKRKLCQCSKSEFPNNTNVACLYVDLAQITMKSLSVLTHHRRRTMPAAHLDGSCILAWVEIPTGRTLRREHSSNVLKLVLLTPHMLPLNGVTVRNHAGCISRILNKLNFAGKETSHCLKSSHRSHDVIQN